MPRNKGLGDSTRWRIDSGTRQETIAITTRLTFSIKNKITKSGHRERANNTEISFKSSSHLKKFLVDSIDFRLPTPSHIRTNSRCYEQN